MNQRKFQVPSLLKGAGLATVLLMLTACSDAPQETGGAGAMQKQLPKVTVLTVEPQSIPNIVSLTGRVEASVVAEIRPQVTGIIQQKHFTEGAMVEVGQSLYQIDSDSYQAEYDSAVAEVNRAKSVLKNAGLITQRNKKVVKINAISEQEVDNSIAAEREARASLIASEAALKSAKIRLDRTLIVSPIAGKIGRSFITQGALVSENQATALARVQTLSSMYVDFAMPAHEMSALKEAVANASEALSVDISTDSGRAYPHSGSIRFSEFMVDRATDSVVLRAEFPNPDLDLLPGQFVRGTLSVGEKRDVTLLPAGAVIRGPKGDAMVMVLGEDQTVGIKPVVESGLYQDQWVISSGLTAGEQVIIKGLQFIRPGAKAAIDETSTETAGGTQ